MMKRIVTLDIETGIHGGENPFGPSQDVVAVGFHDSEFAESGCNYLYLPHEEFRGTLARLLAGTKVLVTFNGKFDVQHLTVWQEDYEAWQAFVARGGVLWDCQLAQYLLDCMHPETHWLSLNEVSAMHGGEQKLDAIAELWAAGVNTRDIDRDLLLEYLAGDVNNTRLIFEKQLALARERGQLKSLMVNFGALCCSIEMERNGMYVDQKKAEVLRETLAAEVVTLKATLEEYVPAAVKSVFNWGSRYHKSALLFGGVVKVPGVEYRLLPTPRIDTHQYTLEAPAESTRDLYEFSSVEGTHYVLANGATWQVPTANPVDIPVDIEENLVLFKSGKNEGQPKTVKIKRPDFTRPKTRQCLIPHTLTGHITPLTEWESSPPGVYKVGEEVMEVLKSSTIPFVATLVRYTAAAKDLGTYFWVEGEDGTRKGMLTKVGQDGIIHHKINHVTVVTGRLSSSDPNLQNLPRKDKSTVKKIFCSRFPYGSIVQSDFSSLEVYVQAMLTGAEVLTEALRKGLDVHVLKLSMSSMGEGKSYEGLLELCKGPNATPEWKEKRTRSKEISFQDAYGAGPAKIAKTTGLTQEEVQQFQSADRAANPEIPAFFDSMTKKLIAGRVPHGVASPHPEVAGVMCHLGRAEYTTPDGKRYGFTERPSLRFQTEQGVNQNFSPTEIKNYVVQGTGGEIAKMAMWIAVREWFRRGNFGGLSLLVNQVHDALYVDSEPTAREESLMTLHSCMLAASPAYAAYFSWPLPIHVPAETSYGEDLADEHPASLPYAEVKSRVSSILQRYFGVKS
jgi:DNA polymerase I